MTGNVAELRYVSDPDALAGQVSSMWTRLNSSREGWREEKLELRNYIFATDTTTTSNSTLPWKNRTTLPKLCQIRDNLHSNYLQTLFPNDSWLKWESHSVADDTMAKADAIQAYMSTKVRQSNLRLTMSTLLLDYIDYGNAFAKVHYVEEYKQDENGNKIPGYHGGRVERISPLDIVFDPRASDFKHSPTIVRSYKTIGELKDWAADYPADSSTAIAVQEAVDARGQVAGMKASDFNKQEGYIADGFGSLYDYYTSGVVEILTFEGSVHDPDTGEFLKDHEIVVVDGVKVVKKSPLPSWMSGGSIRMTTWRKRPDNLWGMGPLDNLVGMQYRIDHLENMKADVFDLIAFPPLAITGIVEDFEYGPGTKIELPEGSTIKSLAPESGALQSDFQIAALERKMEEYAGAPAQAMGIRTPGEKTAFEVQALENAAGRIFQEKITTFEMELLEPILNDMFMISREHLDGVDVMRVMDDDFGVMTLVEVSKADITASGTLRPIGARHFAQQAQQIQNMNQLLSSPIGSMVTKHMSSTSVSKWVEDVLGMERFDLFTPHAQLYEAAEVEKLTMAIKEDLQAEAGVTNTGDVV